MAPRRTPGDSPPRMRRANGAGALELRLSSADRASASKRRPVAKTAAKAKNGVRGREPPQRAAARPRRRSGRRSLGVRLVRGGLKLGVLAALWGAIVLAGALAYYAATLPPTSEWAVPKRPPNIAIVSERGDLIANRGDTGGRAVRLADLPRYVPQAVIAIEDRRYRSHFGIDPIGLARAMAANLAAGRLVQGGSTLTQQLAKNLFLEPERTIERKMQEAVLALWLEVKYSKDEILQMYLNRVYLGAGTYGIDAAAHRYFGRPASELTLEEAAMIAGLLKAPSYYAPTTSPERAAGRAATVLRAMREEGYITAAEEDDARRHPARLAAPPTAASGGYVADWVAERLPDFIGPVESDVYVETTIDLGLQRMAQESLSRLLAEQGAKKGVSQGAVVVMDGSGAIKALIGGRDYAKSQFNRAVAAERQPGSAFKPFVYLAALEYGLTPQTMRIDQPTRIGKWTPENYSRKYYGPVTLTRALAHSLNTVAAQLADEVGPERVVRTARRLGIRSPLAANASIALGTSEVTPLELTAAYVPFSNGGFGVVPHVIRRVRTADGEILYERKGSGPGRVVSPEAVGAMNAMLSEALISGTAQRARLAGWPAAGKTGTSQNWRDAWFVGYTAYFTAGVWLGNDDNSPTKRATGGTFPAELWRELMEQVHRGMQVAELPGAHAGGLAPGRDAEVPLDQPWLVSERPAPGARRDGQNRIRPARNEDSGFFRRLFGG